MEFFSGGISSHSQVTWLVVDLFRISFPIGWCTFFEFDCVDVDPKYA